MLGALFLTDVDRAKRAIKECHFTELERLTARMSQADIVKAVDFTVFKHQQIHEIILSRLSDSQFYRIKLLRKMVAEVQGLNIQVESLARLLGAFSDEDFREYFSQDGFHMMALCRLNQLFHESLIRRLWSCCNSPQILNEFFRREYTQCLDENQAELALCFLRRTIDQNGGYVRDLDETTLCCIGQSTKLVKKLVVHFWIMYNLDYARCVAFVSALRLTTDVQLELQFFSLANDYGNVFRAIVEAYGASILVETAQGWNIAMSAAKEGNLDLMKWVLEQKEGRKLLHHKTYNGKTFWNVAAESKNGAILNLIRDFHHENRDGSWENGCGKRDVRPKCGADFRVKRHRNAPDFNCDLKNPNSKLHALMVKKGYAGRSQAFVAVAKNPNNELYLILKGMGYKVAPRDGK